MKAFLSKRAARAATRIDERWGEHADDPGIFARELLEAIEMLETSRGVGAPYPTPAHPLLLRALLRKSRCHVYFEIDSLKQTIQILHIGDGRRARPEALSPRYAASHRGVFATTSHDAAVVAQTERQCRRRS